MKENHELVLHIYRDAEMATYTIHKLLVDLKEKDNKIKKTIEEVLKEYEEWKVKSKKYLKKANAEISENGMIPKMMAGMSIKKEVKNDNSDSAIADLLIQGVAMGTLSMEKKLKQYEGEADKKELSLAKDFLKFQEKTINTFKEYL